MLVLLAAALFGDLVLLPALLAGPLGRFLQTTFGSTADAGEIDEELNVIGAEGDVEDESNRRLSSTKARCQVCGARPSRRLTTRIG